MTSNDSRQPSRSFISASGLTWLTNTAIVGLAVLLGVRLLVPPKVDTVRHASLGDLVKHGGTLALPGFTPQSGTHTAVLVVGSSCLGSMRSRGFHAALARWIGQETDDKNWRLILVKDIADLSSGTSLGLMSDQIYSVDLYATGLWATPMLLIVDDRKRISDLFVGTVTAAQEGRIWSRLGSFPDGDELNNITVPPLLRSDEVEHAASGLTLKVVDLRTRAQFERRHRAGAINLPSNDFEVMAAVKLRQTDFVAIDCAPASQPIGNCLLAATFLATVGFRHVALWVP